MADKIDQQTIIEAVKKDPSLLETPEVKAILVHQQNYLHSGPLPPSDELIVYDKYIPNGADRIMKLTEKSMELMEKHEDALIKEVTRNQDIASRGQIFALVAIFIYAALSFYLAYLGDTKTAAILMGTGLAAIVGAFLYTNKRGDK